MAITTEACPLCQAEKLTHWFEETDLYWIALCKTCNVPMVVLKRHDTDVSLDEAADMICALMRIADAFFGKHHGTSLCVLDRETRQIPDHWHAHARLL